MGDKPLRPIEDIVAEGLSRLNQVARIKLQQFVRDKFREYHPESKVIDLSNETKLWYITLEQASLFGERTPDYKGIDLFVRKHQDQIKEPRLAVVDWGCGRGNKGIHVYQLLDADGRLYQIDYSAEMTIAAAKNAEDACIEIVSENLDLEQIPTKVFKQNNDPSRVHLFLGQTIGNPLHPEDLISGIAGNMRKDEYLLVEWFKTTKEYYGTEDKIEFRLSYLQTLGISKEYVTKDDGTVDHFVDDSEPEWFKFCFRVHKEFVHEETGKKLSPGDVVIATRSRRFEDSEVVRLFEKQNLEGIVTDGNAVYVPDEDPEKRYTLFRKKRSKGWGRDDILTQYGFDIDQLSLEETVDTVVRRTIDFYSGALPAEFISALEGHLPKVVHLVAEKTEDKKVVAKLLDILMDNYIKEQSRYHLIEREGHLGLGEVATIAMYGGSNLISETIRIVAEVAEHTRSPEAVMKTIDVIRKYEDIISERFIVLQISALLNSEATRTKNPQAVVLLADALKEDDVVAVLKRYYEIESIHPPRIPSYVLVLVGNIAQATRSLVEVHRFVELAEFYFKQIEKKPQNNHKIQSIYTILLDIIKYEGNNANISGYIDLAYKFDQRMEADYTFEGTLFGGIRWGLLQQGHATADFIDFVNYFGDLQGIEEIIEGTINAVRDKTWQYVQLMPWLQETRAYMRDKMREYQRTESAKGIAKLMMGIALSIKSLPHGELDNHYFGRTELFRRKCDEWITSL